MLCITRFSAILKPAIPPTNQSFSKLPKICDILFLRDNAATKYQHDLAEILLKSILDIWMISKLRRVNPILWICPFYCPKAAYHGTLI